MDPPDATAELLRDYHLRGDSAARDRLVELYVPLVESFARRYARTADEHDDLFQVGCIGLINAIDRFELDRGGELAAFAVPNIAGEIRRELRDRGSTVRLPRRVVELRGPVRRAQAELATGLGRTPTAAEVARELGADEQDVALALEPGSAALPLDPEAGAGEGAEALAAVDDRLMLSAAFQGLDERARRIVYLRYVRDVEPDEVARQLGISRRQLSRSTQEALAQMRGGLERTPPARTRPDPPVAAPGPADPPPPEPASEPPVPGAAGHSGRLLLRVPSSLHAELAGEAGRRGMSLNRFIVAALADRNGEHGKGEARPTGRRHTALVANVVVLALTVLAALALLTLAAVGTL